MSSLDACTTRSAASGAVFSWEPGVGILGGMVAPSRRCGSSEHRALALAGHHLVPRECVVPQQGVLGLTRCWRRASQLCSLRSYGVARWSTPGTSHICDRLATLDRSSFSFIFLHSTGRLRPSAAASGSDFHSNPVLVKMHIRRRRFIKKSQSLQALSLFSGVGGLELGAKLAGLGTILAVDNDQSALTHLATALGSPTLCGDLSKLSAQDLMQQINGPDPEHLVIIGGPPCTAFSHAGFWLERKRSGVDEQAQRLADFVRFVIELRPAAFVMENVPGLLFKNHCGVFFAALAQLSERGYVTAYSILNAADYGVPQKRRRLFAVGVRSPRSPFQFPCPWKGPSLHRSTRWAFTGLDGNNNAPEPDEALTGKYSSLLELVPPGDNYLFFTSRRGYFDPIFEWRSKYWSFLLKLDPQQPSPTISALRVTNNGPFHWENRHLRLRELARLQTFPDDYVSHALTRKHIGNAVPPLLAAQIFVSLLQQLGAAVGPTVLESLEMALDADAQFSDVSSAFAAVAHKPPTHA